MSHRRSLKAIILLLILKITFVYERTEGKILKYFVENLAWFLCKEVWDYYLKLKISWAIAPFIFKNIFTISAYNICPENKKSFLANDKDPVKVEKAFNCSQIILVQNKSLTLTLPVTCSSGYNIDRARLNSNSSTIEINSPLLP